MSSSDSQVGQRVPGPNDSISKQQINPATELDTEKQGDLGRAGNHPSSRDSTPSGDSGSTVDVLSDKAQRGVSIGSKVDSGEESSDMGLVTDGTSLKNELDDEKQGRDRKF